MNKVSANLLLITLASSLLISGQTRTPSEPKGKPAKSNDLVLSKKRVVPVSTISLTNMGPVSLPEVAAPPPQSQVPQYVPDQILVQLESREETGARLGIVSMARTKARNESLRAVVQEDVKATQLSVATTLSSDNPTQGDILVVNLPADKSPDEAISDLRGTPGVKRIQKNWIYTLQQQTANDSEYLNGALWGMFSDDLPDPIGPANVTTNAFGIHAEKAWSAGHTGSRTVYIGIIDGGVQTDHPDLDQNVWINPGESGLDATGQDKSINGKDDDGNKLPDDARGWDFNHQDGSTYDGEIPDDHGTHVAGTIGALGQNGFGVAGVNWNVTVIPAKVFGATGGTTDRVVEAIDYFVRLKNSGVNIVAINNSWGGFIYDLTLFEAIKRAARAGILFIAAAGNASLDTDDHPFYPACYDTTVDTRASGGTAGVAYDSVISVASIESTGGMSGFSNFGRTTIDLAAPGGQIVSTVPPGAYGFDSGTSMATPHVTGAVALFASTHPTTSARDIKAAVLQSVIATTSMTGRTVTGGRLNVGGF